MSLSTIGGTVAVFIAIVAGFAARHRRSTRA